MTTRNADATRQRILDAAIDEFSQYGMAGARIDRIADKAEANKRMIYIYYDSKEALFTRVVEEAVQRAHQAVPLTPMDLPGYAVALFDYVLEHPELARIEGWRKLEGVEPSNAERAIYTTKIETIAGDDPTGETADMFAAVLALAGAWLNAPQAIGELTTQDVDHQRRRIHETVTAILA